MTTAILRPQTAALVTKQCNTNHTATLTTAAAHDYTQWCDHSDMQRGQTTKYTHSNTITRRMTHSHCNTDRPAPARPRPLVRSAQRRDSPRHPRVLPPRPTRFPCTSRTSRRGTCASQATAGTSRRVYALCCCTLCVYAVRLCAVDMCASRRCVLCGVVCGAVSARRIARRAFRRSYSASFLV